MTDEDFERFLAWLSPDRERAARRYTELHVRLTRIFVHHGYDEPHHLADAALDRAIGKARVVAVGYEGDPAAYVLGIARRILLEHTRSRQRRSRRAMELARAFPFSGILPDTELERLHASLEHCLAELSVAERSLILAYYGDQGSLRRLQRQVLADRARLSGAALRKRTQRIRERLKSKLVAAA